MERLTDSEIKQILEAVAEAYMPKGNQDIASIFTYPNKNGIINDLESMGKSYDFSKEEDVIRAARDAFDWNLFLLDKNHNISEEDITVSSKEAFLYTLVLGHKGAIPYLQGKEVTQSKLGQITESFTEAEIEIKPEEIVEEVILPVVEVTAEREITKGDSEQTLYATNSEMLPILETRHFHIESTTNLPELPDRTITLSPKKQREIEAQAEINEDINLNTAHDRIIEGDSYEKGIPGMMQRRREIGAVLNEINEDTGLNINPYSHDPENASTVGELALSTSLSYPSETFMKLSEINDNHGLAPNFTSTIQGNQWQFPLYGFAEGFNVRNADVELYQSIGKHFDEFHHAHNRPNLLSASYSTGEGFEVSGNYNLYDNKGNNATFSAHLSEEEQAINLFSYDNLGGERSYQGLSFQTGLLNENENLALNTSTMLYSSFPSLTVGVGPVFKVNVQDNSFNEEIGLRADFSLLDPLNGKTGVRLFSDITNKSAAGELGFASETMHLGKPEWHLSYQFDFPYAEESKHELHGKFSYPVTRTVLLQDEAEIEFGEGWRNRLSATTALNNRFAVSGFAEIGDFSNKKEAETNPNIQVDNFDVNLGLRADYLNLGKGVTGGVEVGIQDIGSQNMPYGNIRLTKLLGQ